MFWAPTMSEHENNCQVYVYLVESFVDIPIQDGDTCEDLCINLCKRYGFGPLVQLLLGLRIHDEPWFLAPCARLQAGKKYDFRVRFKVSTFPRVCKVIQICVYGCRARVLNVFNCASVGFFFDWNGRWWLEGFYRVQLTNKRARLVGCG